MADKHFMNPPTQSTVNQQDVIKLEVKQYSGRKPAAQDNRQRSRPQQVPISAAALLLDHNYCLFGGESKSLNNVDTSLKSDDVRSNQPPPPKMSTTRQTRQSAKRQPPILIKAASSTSTGSIIENIQTRQSAKRPPPNLVEYVSSTWTGSKIEKTKKMMPLPPLTFINGTARKSDGTPWKPMDEVKKLLFGPQVRLVKLDYSNPLPTRAKLKRLDTLDLEVGSMVTISSENGSISNSEGVSVQNSIEITSPAVELSSKSPPVDPTVVNSGDIQCGIISSGDGGSVKSSNRNASPAEEQSSKSPHRMGPIVTNSSDGQQGTISNGKRDSDPAVELSFKSPPDVEPMVTSDDCQLETTSNSDGNSVQNSIRSASPTVELISQSPAEVGPMVTDSTDGQHGMISNSDGSSVKNSIRSVSLVVEYSSESPPYADDVAYAYKQSTITSGSGNQLCVQPYHCSSPISPPWSCPMDFSYSPPDLFSFDANSPSSMEATDGAAQLWNASLPSTGRNHPSTSLPTFKEAFGKNRSGCYDSFPILMSSSFTTVVPQSVTTNSDDSMVTDADSSSHLYPPVEERDLSCNFQSLLEDAMSEELEELGHLDFDAFFARVAESSHETGKSEPVVDKPYWKPVVPADQSTSTAKVTVPVIQQFWTSSSFDGQAIAAPVYMPANTSMERSIHNDSMYSGPSCWSMDLEPVEPQRLPPSFCTLRSF